MLVVVGPGRSSLGQGMSHAMSCDTRLEGGVVMRYDVVSALFCPFLPVVCPRGDEIEREAVARWIRWMGFENGSRGARKLRSSQFTELLGRCHPTASPADLDLIIDFVVWLFLWDDQFDAVVDGVLAGPEEVRAWNERAGRVLSGGAKASDDGALLGVLASVVDRLKARMSEAWLSDFARDLQDYFRAIEWESRCRSEGVVPDVETYIRMRRSTSGVLMVFDLIEVAEQIELPARVLSDPTLAAMSLAAANIIAWSNDIFSVSSDLADGGHLNLVLSLQRDLRLDLEEAVARAVHLHNAEVRHFLALERALPSFGSAAPEAALFVKGLGLWIRANFDWSLLTGRYEVAPAARGSLVRRGIRPLLLSVP